jgi:hypothetical protein
VDFRGIIKKIRGILSNFRGINQNIRGFTEKKWTAVLATVHDQPKIHFSFISPAAADVLAIQSKMCQYPAQSLLRSGTMESPLLPLAELRS